MGEPGAIGVYVVASDVTGPLSPKVRPQIWKHDLLGQLSIFNIRFIEGINFIINKEKHTCDLACHRCMSALHGAAGCKINLGWMQDEG